MPLFNFIPRCILIFMMLATPASALEWLSETELERQCKSFLGDPQSRDGASCVAFIQGFLAGAEATDGIVAERVKQMHASTGDSYSDRAIRTRIGSRLKEYGTPYYASYCISKDVSSAAVIGKVVDFLNDHPDEPGLTANQIVYMSLVHHFPCED